MQNDIASANELMHVAKCCSLQVRTYLRRNRVSSFLRHEPSSTSHCLKGLRTCPSAVQPTNDNRHAKPLNCDLLRQAYEYRTIMPAITSFARRQGCSIADGRTDRRCRRIRAQLVSLPMKRVVISRRTCKHCNASTASVFRRGSAGPRGTSAGTASPSAARPSRTSVRLSGTSRFRCPQVLSSCYWHYYYFCSYC